MPWSLCRYTCESTCRRSSTTSVSTNALLHIDISIFDTDPRNLVNEFCRLISVPINGIHTSILCLYICMRLVIYVCILTLPLTLYAKLDLPPCIKKLLNSGGEGEGMMSYFGNVVLEFGFFHTIKSHSFTDKPISI